MNFSVPGFLAFITSWLAATVSVWMLFDLAERVASEETRMRVSQWLGNIGRRSAVHNWPQIFSDIFDHLFTKRHLSFRCFLRSCVASIALVTVLTTIWIAFRYHEFQLYLIEVRLADVHWYENIFLAITVLTTMNLIPDYFSLLETRWVLGIMSRSYSPIKSILSLILDLFLTISISLFGVIAFYVFQKVLVEGWELYILPSVMLEYFYRAAQFKGFPGDINPGIFFYSTLLTSVWIYLYLGGGLIIKLYSKVSSGTTKMLSVVDVKRQPIRSIGMLAASIVTLIYLVIALLRLLM